MERIYTDYLQTKKCNCLCLLNSFLISAVVKSPQFVNVCVIFNLWLVYQIIAENKLRRKSFAFVCNVSEFVLLRFEKIHRIKNT